MMQTGIFTGYFPYALEETAKKIRALDFNTVQLDMHFKDIDLSAGQITKDKCVRIRETFRDHHLPISCISGYTNIIHPDKVEREALSSLDAALAALPAGAPAEDVQNALYDVARAVPRYQDFSAKGATPERPGVSQEWFAALYRTLIGQEKGPRFGSFVALYGVPETRALIGRALSGELAQAA